MIMLRKLWALPLFILAATAAHGAEKPGPYRVGFSEFTLGVAWRVQSNEEFKYAAGKNPEVKEYFITQADGDVSKQIADIEDLISRGIDILVINAGSPRALVPVVNKAVAAGIVVVDFDNTTDSQLAYHLTIDQHEFGRIGAEWLAEILGGKGRIIVFNGISGTSVSAGRFEGAESVFKRYPGIEIVQTVFGGWDYATSKRAIESLFAAYPAIDGIWSQGGAMSEAVIDAYLEHGLNPPPITGEDNNGFFRAWTEAKAKNPAFDSVSLSCPTWMSSAAMELGIDVLKGGKVEKTTILPIPTITKDNMKDYYRPDLPDSYSCNTRLPEEIVAKMFSR
ncbi:MAG: ABC transporter substrate-binding protein [Planctomycetota bacterium]|jgi:ribose transport system substrate-binding protein|nr:ABC transporter substrate-binding protein [Planctomycetota bacterium]